MKSDFLVALTQLAAERNLPREMVLTAIEAALASAYRKDSVAAGQDISGAWLRKYDATKLNVPSGALLWSLTPDPADIGGGKIIHSITVGNVCGVNLLLAGETESGRA